MSRVAFRRVIAVGSSGRGRLPSWACSGVDEQSRSSDEADTLFLQLMHFHHDGAIAMSQAQIENGGYQPLVELAQQMIDIQTAEMQEIEQLLKAQGESVLTQ